MSKDCYLGMRPGDLKGKDYAGFWNPDMAPLPAHIQNALLLGEVPSELAFRLEDAGQLLCPGYLPLENGYARLPNGQHFVATRTDMRGATGAMFEWWMGWHYMEAQRYKLWHPQAHMDNGTAGMRGDDPTLSDREKYMTTHRVTEYVGTHVEEINISFFDPHVFFGDDADLSGGGTTALVCGRVDLQKAPITVGWIIHQIRELDTGTELRSRFWLGRPQVIDSSENDPRNWLLRSRLFQRLALPQNIAPEMIVHCAAEMNHLAGFLEELYTLYHQKERRDSRMIKKIIASLAVILIALFAYLHSVDYRPIVERGVARVVSAQSASINVDPDEVKLIFCGTGSPTRNPFRASPCLALQAYGKIYLFDAGEGAIAKMLEYKVPVLRLEKVFLTHLHSDHMSGVAEVFHNTWLYGREHPIELLGPPGTEKLLDGIRMSYEDDIAERMYVLGPDGVLPENAFPGARDIEVSDDEIVTVLDDGKLRISAFHVEHPHWSHAYGYRIEVAGKTIVISGDTRPSKGIRRYAAGADYLIHEAFNADFMRIAGVELEKIDVPVSASRLRDIGNVHTKTLDLADIAESIGVQHLVLTHLIPPVPNIMPARRAFTSGMSDRYEGSITVAYDGMELNLQ